MGQREVDSEEKDLGRSLRHEHNGSWSLSFSFRNPGFQVLLPHGPITPDTPTQFSSIEIPHLQNKNGHHKLLGSSSSALIGFSLWPPLLVSSALCPQVSWCLCIPYTVVLQLVLPSLYSALSPDINQPVTTVSNPQLSNERIFDVGLLFAFWQKPSRIYALTQQIY